MGTVRQIENILYMIEGINFPVAHGVEICGIGIIGFRDNAVPAGKIRRGHNCVSAVIDIVVKSVIII